MQDITLYTLETITAMLIPEDESLPIFKACEQASIDAQEYILLEADQGETTIENEDGSPLVNTYNVACRVVSKRGDLASKIHGFVQALISHQKAEIQSLIAMLEHPLNQINVIDISLQNGLTKDVTANIQTTVFTITYTAQPLVVDVDENETEAQEQAQ